MRWVDDVAAVKGREAKRKGIKVIYDILFGSQSHLRKVHTLLQMQDTTIYINLSK